MLVTLLAGGALVYRVSRALAVESGPGDAFGRLRVRAEAALRGAGAGDATVAGLTCVACVSLWVGLAAALVTGAPWWHGLAYSGAATWLWAMEPAE